MFVKLPLFLPFRPPGYNGSLLRPISLLCQLDLLYSLSWICYYGHLDLLFPAAHAATPVVTAEVTLVIMGWGSKGH